VERAVRGFLTKDFFSGRAGVMAWNKNQTVLKGECKNKNQMVLKGECEWKNQKVLKGE
jgi:hypothetical protein